MTKSTLLVNQNRPLTKMTPHVAFFPSSIVYTREFVTQTVEL